MSKTSLKKKKSTTSQNKLIIPFVVVAVIFIVIGFGISYFNKSLYTVMKVPDFELINQNGKKFQIKICLERCIS